MIYADIHADGHSANSLFGSEDAVHRYNPTYTPRLLRERFLAAGIELNTPDLNRGRDVKFELHLEGRPLGPRTRPRYLLALENPDINALNASPAYAAHFDLVFAWDARLHALANVRPILIPHPMQAAEFAGPGDRTIFSCLINANKAFKEVLPRDLYVERLKVIRWYEQNAPECFELYGMGWQKLPPSFHASGRLLRGLAQLGNRLTGRPAFPSFRGEVRDKASVLSRARFSYCYENSRGLDNYVTEKVLDSLVAGCVPVYWGADNVSSIVAPDCFIDRRDFSDTAEVHRYLRSVTDVRLMEYQDAIRRYLASELARQLRSTEVVNTVVDAICTDARGQGALSAGPRPMPG
jgi:hypothetical protein